MENASKALIIAGAILLSIIIISLGLMVVNNARNQINNADMSDGEITQFNSKFTNYEGKNVTLNRVQSLISDVRTVNITENKNETKRFITLTYGSSGTARTTATTSMPAIPATLPTQSSKTYTVTMGYDNKTGLIVGIHIKDN